LGFNTGLSPSGFHGDFGVGLGRPYTSYGNKVYYTSAPATTYTTAQYYPYARAFQQQPLLPIQPF
jgi:hypothetical protein